MGLVSLMWTTIGIILWAISLVVLGGLIYLFIKFIIQFFAKRKVKKLKGIIKTEKQEATK